MVKEKKFKFVWTKNARRADPVTAMNYIRCPFMGNNNKLRNIKINGGIDWLVYQLTTKLYSTMGLWAVLTPIYNFIYNWETVSFKSLNTLSF